MSLMSTSHTVLRSILRVIPRSNKCVVKSFSCYSSVPAALSIPAQQQHAVRPGHRLAAPLLGHSCLSTSTKLLPCGCCGIHNSGRQQKSNSSGESTILEFLDKEIKYEVQKQKSWSDKVGDFKVETNGAEIIFSKKSSSGEEILVTVNVNNAVDAAPSFGKDSNDHQENNDEIEDMACQPSFVVDMKKDGKTLSLTCSFTDDSMPQDNGEFSASVDSYADLITIDEVCIHDGEWKDKNYHVSTAIMDEQLYDNLIRRLEDQGIDDQFINNMVEHCTAYEHSLYLKFLKDLQSYIKL
ncbi:complement component 1 Q subcomponent-binding protein, mitochondrial-like [Tubulanus polymorphus]|uniref:complement component 1 Q subcomponent-binding protein, mitochondrial-like n=1 Tax=Tubulanus polymorphus TaxID=672921 RepID=UPI003DA6BA1C